MNLDYNTRLAAIQRNEKLAQIMQQQAFQPIEVQSYNGIQAPISPLSGLAKVLQAYMGARGTGDEERIKLNQEAKAEAQSMLAGLNGMPATQGRPATMGSPEVPAQPATSFKPMGADFEDNPNLPVAPSGNVETPAVAYQPAVAPQAAIPPSVGMALTQDQRRQKLVEMMMGQNPYASPIAKVMYESLEKENAGPLAKYNLYVAQTKAAGGTPLSIDEFETRQKIAGATRVTNNIPSSMAPMWVRNKTTGQMQWIQADNRGGFDLTNFEQAGTTEVEKLIEARDRLPKDSPDRAVLDRMVQQLATKSYTAGATVEGPKGRETLLPPPPDGMVYMKIDGVPTAIPIAQAQELNAKYQGAAAKAKGTAEAELDLVSVPDPKGTGAKVYMTRSELAAQAAGGKPPVASVDTKAQQGQTVLDLASRAKAVLPQASSGLISSLFTMATDAAGVPTDKSKADGQLRVIGGALTSNMPRMEGPQSDADRLLYQQSAADVANPNKPYQTRMAALETVIGLNEKYAATPSAPPAGAVRRITPK
jgi:hypothetical protein